MEQITDQVETTEEMIDRLGQDIMAMAVMYLTRIRKGEKITEEEKEGQKEAQEQHKILCSTYNRMQRSGRLGAAGTNKDFDKQLNDKIRDIPNALGDIVKKAVVPPPSNETKQEEQK